MVTIAYYTGLAASLSVWLLGAMAILTLFAVLSAP
jgi:hypothetical protein